MGGVLLQKLEDDLWHPIAFRSQSMVKAEQNYEIYDKEMLAIVRALKDWCHYLEGLLQSFDIISDHWNLEYWRTAQNLTRRQAWWSLYLSHFDFHLTHKPGTTNTQADPLSCISTHLMTDADDNRDQIILRPDHFASVAATSIEESNTLEQQIWDVTDQDLEVVFAIWLLKEHGPQQATNGLTDWEQRNGLTFYKGRIYILKVPNLRKAIVCLGHDSSSAGHPGWHSTLKLVSHLYWWPGMTTFINKYVAGCDTCQHCKPARHLRSMLQPHDVPKGPCQMVGIDLITGLPLVGGYNTIIVYIDHYSKQVHALPTTSDINAKGVADLHYHEIFCLHGIPTKIVSDRGPQFTARLMKALYQKLGIIYALTTA
jgi:hypothetical protein